MVVADPEIISLTGAEMKFWPRFLADDQAGSMLVAVRQQTPWVQSDIRIAGRTIPIPRLNAWYGDVGADYSYSGVALETLPWTSALAALKSIVEAATQHDFNSALVNLYRDNRDSVDWHADDEPELGPQPIVASLSLGESRTFELRRKDNHREKFKLVLPHGSLLLMAGNTQRQWQHRVAKEKPLCGERVNITFRKVHNRP